MTYSAEDRAIALAGVFQASALVADLAHGRPLDETAFAATLQSLFEDSPATVADVYGGIEGVRLGLLLLRDGLEPERQQAHTEVIRYAVSIVQVERRFARRPNLQQIMSTRLERVQEQRVHFDVTHDTIVGALASLYQDTLSTLRQRIQVVGNAGALQDDRTADRIRAALLGGVRGALLWHQTGGRRWRLLLNRRAVQHAASALVDRLP
ncbi:MAG TPA: high frequency lysogenization protein HflD [Pseudomonadales bacterium]|nr:high frequency lysogenization protein HflD [Pseudomonadales bacterium]